MRSSSWIKIFCHTVFYLVIVILGSIVVWLIWKERNQIRFHFSANFQNSLANQASSHDQIKMSVFQLAYDQKIFTPKNINVGTWPKFTTPTNINFTPKKYAGAVGLDRSPSPSLHWLGHLLRSSRRIKTSGTEVRRTPDVRLRLVIVNFGQIQLLRFVVVMIRSNSFGHLDLVKLVTLLLN